MTRARPDDVRRRQFCPHGHDTHRVGRTSRSVCRQCARDRARAHYHSLSDDARRALAADRAAVRAALREATP